MPVYDYKCECGHREDDCYYARWSQAPVLRLCPKCQQVELRKMIGTRNFIHPTHSGLYGRPEPALGGDSFESYDHKKRLLAQWGAMEASDRVKGARLYQDANRPGPRSKERMAWGDDTATLPQ